MSSMAPAAVIVKNTFFELNDSAAEEHKSQRRVSSAPPKLRRAASDFMTEEVSVQCVQCFDTANIETTASLDNFDSGSTVSTKTRSDRWSDIDTQDSSDENEDAAQTDAPAALKAPIRALTLDNLVTAESRTAMKSSAKAWAPRSQASTMASTPTASPMATPTGTPLRIPTSQFEPKVVPPMPSFMAARTPLMATAAKRDFAEVVAAAQSALRQSNNAVVAEQEEGKDGWTVTLKVQVSDSLRHDLAIAVAKAALLSGAEGSGNVYVVGYQTEPFQQTPDGRGFVAHLARVEDETSACWNLLERGFCARGARCSWKHYEVQATIRVLIEYLQ